MSFDLYKQATFATGLTGDVGYALYDSDGSLNTARTITGVFEIGTSGIYGAVITFPDSFDGSLLWDNGQPAPTYFSEAINSQLSPYVAPATAYATLAELRAYLKLADAETADDDLLSTLLVRVQGVIDNECGRTFAVANPSTRYFDAIQDSDGVMLWFPDDCAEIVSITNGDSVAVSASDYVTEPRNRVADVNGVTPPLYAVRLKSSSGKTWTYEDDPENAIAVNAYWGYTRYVPDVVKQATITGAGALYRQVGTNPDALLPVLTGGGRVVEPVIGYFDSLIKRYRRKV